MTIMYNAQKWNKQQEYMKTSAKKVTYKNILHFEVLGGRNQI